MSPLHTDKMNVPASTSPIVDSTQKEIVQDTQQPLDGKKELSEEELERMLAVKKAERIKLKQHLVSVLERGAVASRLDVTLPKGVHGEWVRDDVLEIDRLRKLGFELDTEFAVDRSLHDDGGGNRAKIGDVVFMTCKQEVKDLIDEIRSEQAIQNHSPKRKQKEEASFMENTKKDTGGVVPTFSEGSAREALKGDIAAALDLLNQP